MIPPINSKGVFKFAEPFNTDAYNNRIFKVSAIRNLIELYKEGADPQENIYIRNGMTQRDYLNDLENQVPIVVLTVNDDKFYYIPSNKILSVPMTTGIPYKRKILTVSLGIVPDTLPLEKVISNTEDVLKDTLGIISKVDVIDASDIILKTVEEDAEFRNRLVNHPNVKVSKSYKIRYKEMQEKYDRLFEQYQELNKFMINTWNNNVNNVVRPTPDDLLKYTKKIKIEMVSKTLTTKFGLSSLLFYLYNSFNKNPIAIYAKGFTDKVTSPTNASSYGVLDKTPFTMTMLDGTIRNQHLPYIFSVMNSVTFEPGHGLIEIVLNEPINIRGYEFKPVLSDAVLCDKIRISMFNKDDSLISSITYTDQIDYNNGTDVVKAMDLQLQVLTNQERPLPTPTS